MVGLSLRQQLHSRSVLRFYLTVGVTPAAADNSYWGAKYFPNVPLITQDGKTIHFYDDMLKGKIVLINFIYTECGETCRWKPPSLPGI